MIICQNQNVPQPVRAVQREGDQATQSPQDASHLGNYGVKGCVHELDGFPCLVLVGPLVQRLPDVEHVIEVVHLLQKNTSVMSTLHPRVEGGAEGYLPCLVNRCVGDC